jgi:glycosyltransferase involved in cell wall biosynthesis
VTLYFWDSLRNSPGSLALLREADCVFTFDPHDAKAHQLELLPLFFVDATKPPTSLTPSRFQMSFIGSAHCDRLRVISKVQRQVLGKIFIFVYFPSKLIFYFRMFFDRSFRYFKKGELSLVPMSKKATEDIFTSSTAVLDVHHLHQAGLTMRTIESLALGRKLITTNETIREYPFFDPQTIFVVDRRNPVVPESFFLESAGPDVAAKMHEYEITKWVSKVLSGGQQSHVKKILIISQYFWPEEFLVNSLAAELKEKGHEVTVLTGLPNYPQGKLFPGYSFFRGPWQEEYHGVKVRRVPLLPRGQGFARLSLNYFSFVVSGIIFGSFSVRKNFDVIFCFALSPVTSCLPAIFFRWLSGRPLVLWVQDLWPESVAAVGAAKSEKVLGVIGMLVRFIYKRCDLILIQSQAFKKSILQWGGEENKIEYIPNWAKTVGGKASAPTWLQNAPSGFKVVFAGNIGKAQDMPTVLKAAEILREYSDIHWLIVGDGSEKRFVDEEVARRKLSHAVHLYGRQPQEDMPGLFSFGDVMLVSLTDEYIFSLTVPSKLQGYMASGRPILAALNGEGARIVHEAQAGLSCPAESPEKLAEKVLEFYRMSQAQRETLGRQGKLYFEQHFEQSIVVKQIEDACQRVASKFQDL